MSHLNMGPNPVLDKLMREWSEEVKNRYRIHLIEPAMKPRITLADEPSGELTAEESRLPRWARAWLKVAKGIIG